MEQDSFSTRKYSRISTGQIQVQSLTDIGFIDVSGNVDGAASCIDCMHIFWGSVK